MWIDALIMLPVTVFLIWLFSYSAPAGRPLGERVFDMLVMAFSVLAGLVVLWWMHETLETETMGRSVMAVAGAYMVFLATLAAGWLRRFSSVKKGGGDHPRKKESD